MLKMPSNEHGMWLGAGCQCQYPYFCLIFVHCPHFVLILSYFCLTCVPFLSTVPLLSCLCLQILSFVLIWASFCHHRAQKYPTFVLFWPSESMTNDEDKYWTKLEINHFSIFYLVTLQLDKKWTILGHSHFPSLSSFCPSILFNLQGPAKPWVQFCVTQLYQVP